MAPQNDHEALDRKIDVLYKAWVDSGYSGRAETKLRFHMSEVHAREDIPLWLSAKLAIYRFDVYRYKNDLDAARRATYRALKVAGESLTAARRTWLERQMEHLDEQHDLKYRQPRRLDEKFDARQASKSGKKPTLEPSRSPAANDKVLPEAANDKATPGAANDKATPGAANDRALPEAANDKVTPVGLAKSFKNIETKAPENQNSRRDSVQANQITTTNTQDDSRARVQAWVDASATSRGHTSSLSYSPSQLDEAPSRRARSDAAPPCDKYGRQIMDGGKRKRPSKKEQREAEQRDLEDRLYNLKSKKRKVSNSNAHEPKRRATAAKRLAEGKAEKAKMNKERSVIQKQSEEEPDKQDSTKAKVDPKKSVRVPAISMTVYGEKSISPSSTPPNPEVEDTTPKPAPTKKPIVKKPIVKGPGDLMAEMVAISGSRRLVKTTKMVKVAVQNPKPKQSTEDKSTAGEHAGSDKANKLSEKKQQAAEKIEQGAGKKEGLVQTRGNKSQKETQKHEKKKDDLQKQTPEKTKASHD